MSAENNFLPELVSRYNDKGYINWLKAGQCLSTLLQGLRPYMDKLVKDFHRDLLTENSKLQKPCLTECKPKGKKFSPSCNECTEWKKVIEVHQRQHAPSVNWDNCDPPSWRTDPWEVAKAYMPRGQVNVRGAAQFDASALLHLIKFCDCFSVDREVVTAVIQFRNELMHSAEFSVEDDWITHYLESLENLLQQFNNETLMEMIKRQMDMVLKITITISPAWDGGEASGGRILPSITDTYQSLIQWEIDFLQEFLREVLHTGNAAAAAANEDDDSETQNTEQLRSLVRFLQTYKDLRKRFSAELQSISSLLGEN